jgi:hypothetical protein
VLEGGSNRARRRFVRRRVGFEGSRVLTRGVTEVWMNKKLGANGISNKYVRGNAIYSLIIGRDIGYWGFKKSRAILG